MAENESLEAVQDRKITWGLIAAVFMFVIVMSGIVLWITTSLIQNELGKSDQPVSPTLLVSDTPIPPSPSPMHTPEASKIPTIVDATWTPDLRSKEYVKFLYYYVKPTKIIVGECVQITWETENAVSLQLYRNGELILDNPPANKTLQDCPKELGYTVYRLVGVNNIGQNNWIELQVKVQAAP